MRLALHSKLLRQWEYVLDQGPHLIVMRHAPKAGDNESDLSQIGKDLAWDYGRLLAKFWEDQLSYAKFKHSEKQRTFDTLRLIFPDSNPSDFQHDPRLNSPQVTEETQAAVNRLHLELGRWLSYTLSQTYYFLEALGGEYDGEHLHETVASRVSQGLGDLLQQDRFIVHCGHSPSLEAACCKMLGLSLAEINGFLNPLDSLHLQRQNGRTRLIARINPISGYEDIEADEFLMR